MTPLTPNGHCHRQHHHPQSAALAQLWLVLDEGGQARMPTPERRLPRKRPPTATTRPARPSRRRHFELELERELAENWLFCGFCGAHAGSCWIEAEGRLRRPPTQDETRYQATDRCREEADEGGGGGRPGWSELGDQGWCQCRNDKPRAWNQQYTSLDATVFRLPCTFSAHAPGGLLRAET